MGKAQYGTNDDIDYVDILGEGNENNNTEETSDHNDPLRNSATDTSPLLENNAKVGWGSWLKSKAKSAWNNGIKPAAGIATAAITAAQNGINGIMVNDMVSSVKNQAKDIVNASWWKSLTPGQYVISALSGPTSFLINAIMNSYFIPTALKNFVEDIKKFRQKPISTILALTLAIAGAIGTATIAGEAFDWYPGTIGGDLLVGSIVGFNLLIFMAQRYVGVRGLANRTHQLSSDDVSNKNEVSDLLEHLATPDHKLHFEGKYKNILESLNKSAQDTITKEEAVKILLKLANELESYAKTNKGCVADVTKGELFIRGFTIFIDLAMTLTFASCAQLTFTQSGFNGINAFASFVTKLFTGTPQDLESLNPWAKRAIGFTPGNVSAIFYGMSALEIRDRVYNRCKQIYRDEGPKAAVNFILLLIANAFSGASMLKVALNYNKPNNIIFLQQDAWSYVYVALVAMGGAIVNTNSSMKRVYESSDRTVKSLDTLPKFTEYLKRTHDLPFSYEDGSKLSEHLLEANVALDKASKFDHRRDSEMRLP